METWIAAILLAVLIGVLSFAGSRSKHTTGNDAPAHGEQKPRALSTRLHQLGQEIEPFVNSAAHASDLLEHAPFQDVVKELSKSNVEFDTVVQYATGGNAYLAAPALVALAEREDRENALDEVLGSFTMIWPATLHFALLYIESLPQPPAVGVPLTRVSQWWVHNPAYAQTVREYLDRREDAGDTSLFGDALEKIDRTVIEQLDQFLQGINQPLAKRLKEELKDWQGRRVDRVFLETFGQFWKADDSRSALSEPEGWKENLERAEEAIVHEPPSSVLVSGLSRVGKTSFLKLLGARLTRQGWSVFDASGAELMAGQTYFGQLEERIRKLVAELDAKKHVAWYVSDLSQIAESGTHQGQKASILDQIMPAITSGRLVILAEATPSGVSRLLQQRPSIRSLLEVFRLEPMGEGEARDLMFAVAALIERESTLKVDPTAPAATMQLAQHYLGANPFPGPALDLLKMSANRALAAGEGKLTAEGVLGTLSQVTGLPRSILDDKERIDLASIRGFFAERVIGQDEAVSAIIDRIAMLKAGLVDPSRPIGVFLFAGPTGSGKTELAKTLAQFLFASADRMIRLDMSEFQAPESTTKILGERGYQEYSDSLIERVRKQPFSVILLDEFEKAHANVWDLFLQLFDDGRLTDANGRTGDFRHSIIILTSNLGATSHMGMGVGFAPVTSAYSEEQVMRAAAQTFRPEFVNRIDKIIVFKPLSRALIREILHKELRGVLERRGLRNREWAVEWEPSAIEFLLDKGFTQEMGARPLKRAIDQHLLAPLAATLVEHRFPEGDQFLFVRSNGTAIEVEFVDPDAVMPEQGAVAVAPEEDANPASLAAVILRPRENADVRASLAVSWSAVNTRLAAAGWIALKDRLHDEMNAPGFWNRADRHRLLGRIGQMDRVQEAARTAERLKRRLDSHASREIAARLALQLYLVEQGIDDVAQDAPVDALLNVEPVFDGDGKANTDAWCTRILGMYRKWADRRHMQLEELAPPGGKGPGILQVSGFGACRTLIAECGLHVLDEASGQRAVARVRVSAGPPEEPSRQDAFRAYAALIAKVAETGTVVRRYREDPSPLVRDAGGWRSGRLEAVLAGDFDLIAAVSSRS